jgi:DNA-binding transcriptional MocR family regulator
MSEQGELFQAETTWFHLFKTMIDGGDAAKMGPYAFMVYCVIKSHTNFATGHSFPSIETIAKKSGVSERKIKEELQTLEEMGYITKTREGRNNRYTLREKVEIIDAVGRPHAVATWDYLPATVKAAVADLKNVVMSGDFDGAKLVTIQNLHVEIKQMVVGGTGIQINQADLDRLPPELREQLERLREQSATRG